MVLIGAAVLAIALLGAPPAPSPTAALERLRMVETAPAADVQAALDAGLAGLAGSTRMERCMDAFQAGELYRLAAAAAPAPAPGGAYAEEALRRFREMRVEYLDLVAGQLGYVGEARVHRQQGNPREAIDALAPLLAEDADARMRPLAELEVLEARLQLDADVAAEEAAAYGKGAEWVLARAHAARGAVDEAAAVARDEAVLARVSPYDRLGLLAQLGVLTDAERAEWARTLIILGRRAQAHALLEGGCPAPATPVYAMLLEQDGRYADAARQWMVFFSRSRIIATSIDPRQWMSYGRCLAAADEPALRARAPDAYAQALAMDAPVELQRDALRQWVGLVGPDAARETLAARAELVRDDPYLAYAWAASRRADGDPAVLAAELEDVERIATDDDLRAAAILMRAQVTRDPREAIGIVEANDALLRAQPTTAGTLDRFIAVRRLELGMIDAVAAELAEDPAQHSAEVLLTVGSALADRYEERPDDETRARVVQLAAAAIGRASADEIVALRSARVMTRVDAFADADRVLATVNAPEAALLRADVARRRGRPQEALAALEGHAGAEADLLRGQCLLDIGDPDAALAPLRVARRDAPEGSDLWWEATVALGRAQVTLGNREAAAAILRVAETLHPPGERRSLRRRLDTLKQELD